MEARVWLGPDRHPDLERAITDAGGSLVALEEANAIVWSGGQRPPPPQALRERLHGGIVWVQLDSAGVEGWLADGLVDDRRAWTAAQGAYAPAVAEHALALVLAAARRLPELARRTSWSAIEGERLAGRTVGIVGAGGIGRELIARLAPFGVRILALTRSGRAVAGAHASLPLSARDELLAESDYVVLAAPLTAETRGSIGPPELELIGPRGWLVNVGRGALVDTDALVAALTAGRLGGACLDVTDPEPLPDGHPLWRFPNVLVTPHVANTWAMLHAALAERIGENVRRFREGRELLGRVDRERGY